MEHTFVEGDKGESSMKNLTIGKSALLSDYQYEFRKLLKACNMKQYLEKTSETMEIYEFFFATTK